MSELTTQVGMEPRLFEVFANEAREYRTSTDWPPKCLEEYHRWYFYTMVWCNVSFLNVPCSKSVADMWNYQEIIASLKPALVVEFGTCKGGSALFFATVLAGVSQNSRVLSVDVNHDQTYPAVKTHPQIELMTCSSTDFCVVERIQQLRDAFPGPLFAILDSYHEKSHVLQELLSLRPVLQRRDYVVVEDTAVNGHPILKAYGDGPYEAVQEYIQMYPQDFIRDTRREQKFGFTFAPGGFLIRR